jgi:hypothetical protein
VLDVQQEAKYQYYKKYVKTGSEQPIYHVIAIMFTLGYSLDYMFHLREFLPSCTRICILSMAHLKLIHVLSVDTLLMNMFLLPSG